MKFLIITGLSGAGKSRAADILEDMDYYCVDNMPAALLPKLAEFCLGMGSRYEKVALVTDIRDAGGVDAIYESLDKLLELGCAYEILFLEADRQTIVKRQKESRRPHPLQGEAGSLEAAIALEIRRLEPLRERANYVLNTGVLTLGQLQKEICRLFSGSPDERQLRVTVMSFGYKYGLPIEADMVLDVRFLANPYYDPALREKNGMDPEIADFVLCNETAEQFLRRTMDLIEYLLPNYIEEGKRTFTVAVGCTGGRHRSVASAAALCRKIAALGYETALINRDVEK